MDIRIGTGGVQCTWLVDLEGVVGGAGDRASREFSQAVVDLQGRAVLQRDGARVGHLAADHGDSPTLRALVEDTEVTADGGTEGDVVGAGENDITAIDEGRCRGTECTCRIRGGLVLVRIHVVATDDRISLVGTKDTREGGAIAEDEEVGITRLSHRPGAEERAANLDIHPLTITTRIDNAGADVRRDVAIPKHIGARIVQRTAVVQHDAGVIAGNGVEEE